MLGPIALYPDPLIAQILPAATLPTQVVLANHYVSGGGNPNQIDRSRGIQHRGPGAISGGFEMDGPQPELDNGGGTGVSLSAAGRDGFNPKAASSAYNLNNLQSTPQQQVISDGGNIEIVPADPQVIYVPVYQPDQVYYQTGYGTPFITFGIGFAIGGWLDCDFDWGHRNIIVWGRGHPRPANWWHEPPRTGIADNRDHTTSGIR